MKILNRKQMEQIGVREHVIAFFEHNQLMGYRVDKLGEIQTAEGSDYQDYIYEINHCMENPCKRQSPHIVPVGADNRMKTYNAEGNLETLTLQGVWQMVFTYKRNNAVFLVRESFKSYTNKSMNSTDTVMKVPLQHIV